MEAKDRLTYTKYQSIKGSLIRQAIDSGKSDPTEYETAEAVAELSFKAGMVRGKMDMLLEQPAIIIEAKQAGEKEGMRTVVEWINTNSANIYSNDTRYCQNLAISLKELQAQLKVWFGDEPELLKKMGDNRMTEKLREGLDGLAVSIDKYSVTDGRWEVYAGVLRQDSIDEILALVKQEVK